MEENTRTGRRTNRKKWRASKPIKRSKQGEVGEVVGQVVGQRVGKE